MTFEEYQIEARTTVIYPEGYEIVYPVLGLCGEAGEVAEKVKRMIRDDVVSEKVKEEVQKELGDVLWYLANTATDLGLSLEKIAAANLAKLKDRQLRDKLHGSGDDR